MMLRECEERQSSWICFLLQFYDIITHLRSVLPLPWDTTIKQIEQFHSRPLSTEKTIAKFSNFNFEFVISFKVYIENGIYSIYSRQGWTIFELPHAEQYKLETLR